MLATLEQPLARPLLQAAVLPLTVVIAIDVADCGRGCVCVLSLRREPILAAEVELNKSQVEDGRLRACSPEARRCCATRKYPSRSGQIW